MIKVKGNPLTSRTEEMDHQYEQGVDEYPSLCIILELNLNREMYYYVHDACARVGGDLIGIVFDLGVVLFRLSANTTNTVNSNAWKCIGLYIPAETGLDI